MNIKNPLIFISVLGCWLFITTYQSCTTTDKKPDSSFTSSVVLNSYVGDESCNACHAQQSALWSKSDHFHSMEIANEKTVLGNFNDVEITLNGVDSRFYKKGSDFYVQTEGPDGILKDYKIEYTFGYRPLQQYLVKFEGGRLQTLHLCWDTEEKKWFNLFPEQNFVIGDWMHWTGGSMTWNSMCAECHSTELKKNYFVKEDSFKTTWSSINVSCESCHGPGKKHVDWVNAGNNYNTKEIKEHLYATTNSTSIEQVENCAPCHSRRSEITVDYRHGDRFLDHYISPVLQDGLYHADGQILDEVYVYASFIQSKMYQNGVKCTDCHNPHSLQLLSIDNTLCTRCHATDTYDIESHHFHAINTEASKCINCHMTGEYYMVNDYRRDHSFRIPRPDQSVTFGTPNACNKCHEDKSATWASNAVINWYGPERKYHFSDDLVYGRSLDSTSARRLVRLIKDMSQPAIARATAVEYLSRIPDSQTLPTIVESLNDRDPLVRISAVQAITPLPAQDKLNLAGNLLDDRIRGVRVSAANTLAEISSQTMTPSGRKVKDKADEEFRELLQAQADLPGGRSVAGQYYDRKGMLDQAEEQYLKGLEMDPYLLSLRENLALLYNRTGRNQLAIEQYDFILKEEPTNGRVHYYLGLIYAEDQNYEQSIESLQQAIQYSPENERGYYNLGIIYQTIGRRTEAEQTFLKGLEFHNESFDLNYAIAILYVQEGRNDEARKHIAFLKSVDPDNPQLQQLYNL